MKPKNGIRAIIRSAQLVILSMLALGLLVSGASRIPVSSVEALVESSVEPLVSLNASCSVPVTKSIRGKSVQFDQCYDNPFTHNGTNYQIHVFYTETNSATNLNQCTVAENNVNRCEHALSNNDDANGDNVNAVAMGAEAETAFRFYIDRNLDFTQSLPLPANSHVNVYMAEDPRLGGIPDASSIQVDDDSTDNNDTLNKRLLAFHEIHHLVQIQYDGSWHDFYGEGVARTIEDRVDTSLDADAGHLFIPEVNGILGNDGNRTADLSTQTYRTVLWWTWLMDQYRTNNQTDPPAPPADLGWSAIRDFYLELETQQANEVGALIDFIGGQGGNFRDDFIDYTLSLYADRFNPSDPRLGYIDAEINAVSGLSGHNVFNSGPDFATDSPNMNVRSSRYWEFNPANQCDYTAFTFDGKGKEYGFSVMTVDGGNLDQRWTSYSTEWARTVRTKDLDRVVGVVTAVDQNGSVDVGRGCVSPTINIKDPTSAAFTMVGLANNPRAFIVRLEVTSKEGSAVAGLVKDDFVITLTKAGGGPEINASIINSTYVLDNYWLLVQAPSDVDGAESGAFYNVRAILGTIGDVISQDTELSSALYVERTQDVVIVLDRSGSMGGTTGKIEAARNAGDLLVNELSDDDQGGYVAFDTDADLRVSLGLVGAGSQRQDLENAIAAEVPLNLTSIGDGMKTAADDHDANGIAENLCSFVLLTDGHQNEPQFWADVQAQVIDNGCAIHSIALGPGANEVLMQAISASVPGGSYDYAPTTGSVPINSEVGWENNLSRLYDHKAMQIAGRQRILTALGNAPGGSIFAAVPSGQIDFDDQTVGQVFKVGETFTTSGIPVTVKPFTFGNGTVSDQGNPRVDNQQAAGGSGQDLLTDNANLDFAFGGPLQDLSLLFGDFGGNLNVEINNDFRNIGNLSELDGTTVGGVNVVVGFSTASPNNGTFTLKGPINQFAIGGQELWIDNVRFIGAPDERLEIPVHEATELVVSVAWQNSTKCGHLTQLFDPDGNKVPDSFRRVSSRCTNDVWEVPAPQDGVYILGSENINQEFFVTASVVTSFELYLFIGQPEQLLQGVQVPILAALIGRGKAVTGAEVTAVVTDPNGARQTLQLIDDGNHGDGEADDGVYGNVYTATSLADLIQPDPGQVKEGEEPQGIGSYAVNVVAVAGKVRREAQSGFVIDAAPDRDGDDLPDHYEIAHGLDPRDPEDGTLDPDMDGLDNVCEFRLGTDPRNSDTDGGGETDGSEVPLGVQGRCVLSELDPLDPSDDRTGPLASFLVIPEATVDGAPFNVLQIGIPTRFPRGGTPLFEIMRRQVDLAGRPVGPWVLLVNDWKELTYTDREAKAKAIYLYKVMPKILVGTQPPILVRIVIAPPVVTSTDPYAPSGSILINNGAVETSSGIVELQLSADDSVRDVDLSTNETAPIPFTPVDQLEMRISNTLNGIGTTPWTAFKPLVTGWDLGPLASEEAGKVFAEFRDNNGNVSEPAAVDTIRLRRSLVVVKPVAPATARTGSEFEVVIQANDVGVENLAGAQFDLEYDAALLTFVDVEPANFIGCSTLFNNVPGALSLAIACTDGHTGKPLDLWGVRFAVSEIDQRQSTELKVTNVVLSDASAPPENIPAVGAATTIILTIGICGDQNNDGNVNIFDAIIDAQIIVGLIEPTEEQLFLSDVVRDGQINIFDALLILQHIVGLTVITECGPSPG